MNHQARKVCRRVKIYVYIFLNSVFNGGDYSASRSSRSNLEVLPLITRLEGGHVSPEAGQHFEDEKPPIPLLQNEKLFLGPLASNSPFSRHILLP